MTVSDMFKIRDYTKAKQRILFYIIFGLSALELLFSIIGLAAGKKGATRFFMGLFCLIFDVLLTIVGGFNVGVTYHMKKDYSKTKIWTINFVFSICFTVCSVVGAIFALVVMFKKNRGLFFGALLFDVIGAVVSILSMIFAHKDSGSMGSSNYNQA